MSIGPSSARKMSSRPTSTAPSRCWKRFEPSGEGLPRADRSAFRFLHVSTDEVYGSLGPNDPPFCETTAYAPNSPYSGVEGGFGSPGAGLSSHLWVADADYKLLQQLRAYPFPEKLIPLMILNALEGKPLPVYGDGMNVRDWLYVVDHCEAITTLLKWQRRRDLQHRRHQKEMPNLEIVETLCHLLNEVDVLATISLFLTRIS